MCLLVLILLVVAMTTPAQTDSWSPFSPEPFVIDRVTLERNTAYSPAHWELHIHGHTRDTCDYPYHIDYGYHAGWLWVKMDRMIPTGATNCIQLTYTTTPFTEVIILSDQVSQTIEQYVLNPTQTLVVEVNDFVGYAMIGPFYNPTVTTATPSPDDSTTPAAPGEHVVIPNSLSVVPTAREMVWVSEVLVDPSQTPVRFTISGHHPDGCSKPIRARYQRDGFEITVEVYRVEPHNQGGLCPAVLLEYSLELPLEENLESGTYTYTVNDISGSFDTESPAPEDGHRSAHVIETVDVLILESYPPQINLAVSGYQPDGCDYETQVTTRRVANTVNVQIFREIPPNTDCPGVVINYMDTIPLGAFDPGQYTFDVNGMVVEVEVE